MAAPAAVLTALTEALHSVVGLRLAIPATTGSSRVLSSRLESLAVEVSDTVVELRLVALALPLLPSLHSADVACRAALRGTPWEKANLRLVVTDLDAEALSGPAVGIDERDRRHPIGP